MKIRKMQLRSLKRIYKKERRRRVTPWKTIAILCFIISLLFTPVCLAAAVFDNVVAAATGGMFWELQDRDTNANYFRSDFASPEEFEEYRDLAFREAQSEGIALLMNNGALPLAAGSRVSTLSSSSVDLISGKNAGSMKTALEMSSFTVNPTLWDFYCNTNRRLDQETILLEVFADRRTIMEVPLKDYPQQVKESFDLYSDAVIITISRGGNVIEGSYLELDQNEKDMMAFAASLKAEGKVNKIVVLLNTANPLQMDFLKGNPYGIDACLWMGTGDICIVADILAGKINPSGSITDTYCYNNYAAPAMQNPVSSFYEGAENATYTVYREGIYVGYKYYETRYEDYVMDNGNPGKYVYADNVVFPFGCGLSYTTFDYSDLQVKYDKKNDRFAVTVTVTNTGSMAGKETVQVYAQSAYTQYDIEKGIEKASVALCGFGKTQLLEPGKSETVTVYVERRAFTGYDAYGAGTYIMDAGKHYLSVATDAHNAVNNILAAKGYTVENTKGRMDYNGNKAMTFLYEQNELDAKTYAKSLSGDPIKNQLADADLNLSAQTQQRVTYLSRSDWEGTLAMEAPALTLTQIMLPVLQDAQYDFQEHGMTDMPVMGAKNGRTLYELIGLSYDDPLWDQLLDQLTFEDMVSLIGDAYYGRMPVQTVQAPGVRAEKIDDRSLSGDMLAATFNIELVYEIGRIIGNEALAEGVTYLYGPDCNIRRTACDTGLEDSFLVGEMAAAQIQAIREKGVDVAVTAFASSAQSLWLNEQTAREIYLKAFQKPMEASEATGVMISNVRWGTGRAYAYAPLTTGILQQEWGNRGIYIADVGMQTQVNAVDGVLVGVTAYNGVLWHARKQMASYAQDPVVIVAMREAAHRNLYQLANSSAMNGVGADTYVKDTGLKLVKIMQLALAGLLLAFVIFAVRWNRAWRRLRKSQAYLNYRTMLQTVKEERKQK